MRSVAEVGGADMKGPQTSSDESIFSALKRRARIGLFVFATFNLKGMQHKRSAAGITSSSVDN